MCGMAEVEEDDENALEEATGGSVERRSESGAWLEFIGTGGLK